MAITIIFLLVLTPQRSAFAQIDTPSKELYSKVEDALRNYFDQRYKLFTNSSITEEKTFFEQIDSGKSISEYEKLLIEIDHANYYNLLYKSYDYWLKIDSITFSEDGKVTSINLKESHEVIFNATAPVVSKMWDLEHRITLKQKDSIWQVTSDIYEDYLWKVLDQSKLTVEEFREVMIDGIQNADVVENKVDHNTPSGAVIQGSYYAAGAVIYAHKWAYSRNPEFYDFGTVDCTNFVSQAMNRGGHIPMTAEQGGIGTSGWYYVNVNNRAAAWTWAPSLYNFIVNQENPTYFPGKGPKGYRVYGFSSLSPGDLIFYNIVNQPQIQDHVVMVVQWSAYQPLVAGHSPSVDYYPYNAFNYSQTFLIHITGY